MIISDKSEVIAKALLGDNNRGITFLKGEGGFTHQKKKIVYTITKDRKGLMHHLKAQSGIEWFFDVMGEGEPLMFIHGWGVDRRIWRQQAGQSQAPVDHLVE